MAKNDNLTDFLKGLADKFRSVLGTADPLNPQEFEDKIQTVRDEAYSQGFAEGGPTGITATAPDVLSGKVFGSGGSAKATGTMPDQSNSIRTITTDTVDQSSGAFWLQTNGDLWIAPGIGYWGSWNWNVSRLTIQASVLRSAIGLTAAKLLKGQTVLGITGTGVSTPAQIGVKPFLAYSYDFYQVDKGEISIGYAPCSGTVRLWYLALSSGYGDMSIEYFKSGGTSKNKPDWTQGGRAYMDIAAQKDEKIVVRFKKYGNNTQGFAYFVYYTAVR